MEKRKYIFCIIVIILIISILIYIKNVNIKEKNEIDNTVKIDEIKEDKEKYNVYDKNTNELIIENISKDQIQLYKDNPDYNPSGL